MSEKRHTWKVYDAQEVVCENCGVRMKIGEHTVGPCPETEEAPKPKPKK